MPNQKPEPTRPLPVLLSLVDIDDGHEVEVRLTREEWAMALAYPVTARALIGLLACESKQRPEDK